jgi:hypothetical protein
MDPKLAAAALETLQRELDRLDAIEDERDLTADEQARYEKVSARWEAVAQASPEGLEAWRSSPDGDPPEAAEAAEAAPVASDPAQGTRATPPRVQTPRPPPRGFGDWLSEGAGYVDDALGVSDFVRGVGRGVTFDAMAPAAAALTPEVDDGTGIQRRYAAGSAEADLAQQYRREDAEAEARSCRGSRAGRALRSRWAARSGRRAPRCAHPSDRAAGCRCGRRRPAGRTGRRSA